MHPTGTVHKCGNIIYRTALGNMWCKYCNRRIENLAEVKL